MHGHLTGVGLVSKRRIRLNPTNHWQTNILVDGHGNIRLVGFCLSMIAAESGNPTFGSVHLGNLRWVAPELLVKPKSLKPTKAGDIYSFGFVILHVRPDCDNTSSLVLMMI